MADDLTAELSSSSDNYTSIMPMLEEMGETARSLPELTNELTLSGNQARARLRTALGRNPGTSAHHVIPYETRYHEVVQKAAKGGFNMNGANNGIRLGPDQHWTQHPAYNDAVWQKLDRIQEANPNSSNLHAATLVQEYTDQLRAGLNRSNAPLR